MNTERIEKILKNTKTSMEVEGFTIDHDLEEVGRKIVTGELDVKKCVADYIEEFKRKRALAHEI
ncbi:MAG: hypothetical protein LBC86_11150 [Oscillospiraceae bacterium]|jgi:hypothetical protein|nr:hypothetical protein [Oscillospiraceae bacterium]